MEVVDEGIGQRTKKKKEKEEEEIDQVAEVIQ